MQITCYQLSAKSYQLKASILSTPILRKSLLFQYPENCFEFHPIDAGLPNRNDDHNGQIQIFLNCRKGRSLPVSS